MAKNEKRVQVTLACEVCKRRNYITTKNKQNDRERIELDQVLPVGPPAHPPQRDPLTDCRQPVPPPAVGEQSPGHGEPRSVGRRGAAGGILVDRPLAARAVTGVLAAEGQ